MEKVNLFISYSHKDKDGLLEFFTYINEQTCPNVDFWYDEKISLGEEWNEDIKSSLNSADIVLLIVSPPFLNSRYIQDNELAQALSRHYNKLSTVIPIFYRYCNNNIIHPSIKDLQGYPSPENPLSEAEEKKDRHYSNILDKLKIVVNKHATQKKINDSTATNVVSHLSNQAKAIVELRNSNKIFLSIPESPEGLELRKNFIVTVEGKIKYDKPKWPFEVVPGVLELSLLDLNDKDRLSGLALLIKESIYNIHIVGTVSDLKSESFSLQYRLAKEHKLKGIHRHSILWLLDPAIENEIMFLDSSIQLELKMLPRVVGADHKTVFKMIDDFELDKEKVIERLSRPFSPLKKVFMFYDFEKDNDNPLRIELRKKIQANNCVIRDSAEDSFESQIKEANECSGAVIFYGPESTSMWYRNRQKAILKTTAIAGAVCIDEPEIEKKIDRDVSVHEILAIRGMNELETGIQKFKGIIQATSK